MTDEHMGISQLLGARARAAPKAYAYGIEQRSISLSHFKPCPTMYASVIKCRLS